MINLKERIEIILSKPVKQVGLLEENRSNAVVIGYEYDEFGGVKDPNNQIILEWNLPEPKPTLKQLESVTDEQITEHKKKELILPACKQYLTNTDFKMTADYDKDTTEIRIIRERCREIIRSIDNGIYPDDIPKEIITLVSELYENKI